MLTFVRTNYRNIVAQMAITICDIWPKTTLVTNCKFCSQYFLAHFLSREARISEFPFVSGAANVLIWPSVRWKKHVYNEEGRLNFRWAGQIYQLHRGKASTKRKQKHIGGAGTKYWWRCVQGVGRGTTLGGRIRRSKQSGQSKKWNNKKLLENMPSSAVIYSRERSEHKEAKTKTRTRTRKFIGGIPILCWGIGAGAKEEEEEEKEEEDKENLITFPILLSADLHHQPTTWHKCFRQIET